MKRSLTKRSIRKILLLAGSIMFIVWTLLPLIWMFISSISPTKHLLDLSASWFPEHPDWSR